jgi:transposase-like protein
MALNCPRCDSSEIAKKGFRKNSSRKKQKYQCTSCNTWFVEDDGFKRMRHTPEIIVRAVHQHEDGLSLSKVQNHLWQHDNVKITRWTISKWKTKYADFLK